MKLILLGAPGAGKGTQAQFIQKSLNIPQIATGDMLRSAVKSGSALGLKVKAVMDKGELVQDELIINLIQERIRQPDCHNGFLFDGFPRTIAQADALQAAHILIDFVIEIAVPDDVIIDRISGRRIHAASGRSYHIHFNPPKNEGYDDITGEPLVQRVDDEISTIKKRLAIYHQQTEILVEYYKKLAHSTSSHVPQYIKIIGVGAVETICAQIQQILNQK